METNNKKYRVIDVQTGVVVGEYASRKQATRRADKLDLVYGAIRYTVNVVYMEDAI